MKNNGNLINFEPFDTPELSKHVYSPQVFVLQKDFQFDNMKNKDNLLNFGLFDMLEVSKRINSPRAFCPT
jgi:hypothetical protein